jgi:hypothetical protein
MKNKQIQQSEIHFREYRGAIKNWQSRAKVTQNKENQNKNATQYVLDTTMHKQTQKNVNKT